MRSFKLFDKFFWPTLFVIPLLCIILGLVAAYLGASSKIPAFMYFIGVLLLVVVSIAKIAAIDLRNNAPML